MKLKLKNFDTPRAMLKPQVYRSVIDFLNQCEFYLLFSGELEPSEKRLLFFLEGRINYLIQTSPNFGGELHKCFLGYVKLLPKIQKLLKQ